MATYGEMVTEVLQIIPKPGQEALIRSKINQIIRYVAGSADYWKAIEETTIQAADGVDAAANIQQITLDSNFRALLYVQYPETISTDKIKVMEIKDVLHLQKCELADNIAYVSGGFLRIKNKTLSDQFNIGSYVYPAPFKTDGTEDALTNWLTIAIPGLIIDLTVAYILNLNGDNEDSKKAKDMADMMSISYISSQVNGAILT